MSNILVPSFAARCKMEVQENQLFVNGYLVEKDVTFLRAHIDQRINAFIEAFSHTYLIDVTERCNMSCKYCYYKVDNTAKDRDIQSILDEAVISGFKAICLMGAEPTVREDLPELIQTLTRNGFVVVITTNGKKLEDAEYLMTLKVAGLRAINYSMHFTESYKLGKRKALVLRNIIESGIPISQLSFTISTLDELREVMGIIELIRELGVRPEQFVIRAGAAIGNCTLDSGLFMSDMMKVLIDEYQLPKMVDGGSNLYFQEFMLGETNLHLVRWPTNATITPYSRTGPVIGTKIGPVLSPVGQVVQALTQEQIDNERALLLDNTRVIQEVVRDYATLRAIETPLMPNRLWIHCEFRSWGLREAKDCKQIWPAFQEELRQKGYSEIYSCVPPGDKLLVKWQTTHGLEEVATSQGQLIFRKGL